VAISPERDAEIGWRDAGSRETGELVRGWRGRFPRVLETWEKGNSTFGGAMVLNKVILKYFETTICRMMNN
jgi:hypothetical protein